MLTATAIAVLLAGCASNPAPVVNYSFGANQPAPAASTAAVVTAVPGATTIPAGNGAQTFAAGHANGTTGAGGYTVAPGDTLYSIAFAHGMDVRQLAALNGLAAPYVIHPGQVLKLGVTRTTVTTTTTVMPGATSTTTTQAAAAPPPPAQAPATQTPAAQPEGPVFGEVTPQPMTAGGVAPATSSAAMPVPAVAAAQPVAPVPAGTPAGTAPPATAPAETVPPIAAAPAVPTPPPGATRSAGGITWQWPASGKVIGGFTSGSGGDGAGLDIAGNMGDPVRAAASGTVVYSGNGLIGYGELVIIKHNDAYLSAYGHNSKRLVSEGQHVNAGQEIALMGASGASRVELHFEIRKDGKPVDPLGYLPQR